MKIKRKDFEISLAVGLCVAILVSLFGFNNDCNKIRKNVLRLHIIANSDTSLDQSEKLLVRDAILESTKADFSECSTVEDAVKKAKSIRGKITDVANKTLSENGTLKTANVTVQKEYFGTRVYDDFTLPAGEYNSLTVKIGEGKGHNWWCVIFPSVCVPVGNDADFETTVGKDGVKIIYGADKYFVKFKIIEIYERLIYGIRKKL